MYVCMYVCMYVYTYTHYIPQGGARVPLLHVAERRALRAAGHRRPDAVYILTYRCMYIYVHICVYNTYIYIYICLFIY